MYEQTTIAAIATPPGEGGIGIIRLSGIDAAEIANRMFETGKLDSFHHAVPYMMYYGKVVDNGRVIDRGLAVYMKAPHSYTGEDVVEFQMHGSVEALRMRSFPWHCATAPYRRSRGNSPSAPF